MEFKSLKQSGIKPSVIKRAERKQRNQDVVERNYQKGNSFPSSDFKNELQADLDDVLVNKGRLITPVHDVNEDILKGNTVYIKPTWRSGKKINLSLNTETGDYINVDKSDLTVAAYRVKVNKSSDISNTQISVSHYALVLGEPTQISSKTSILEFEDGSNEIEAMITPWITDENGVKIPVVLSEMSTAGRNAFTISGLLTGMSVSLESMSTLDILSL